MSTADKKVHMNIYENRWWLLALFFVLFLAYLPTFQYDYLIIDEYEEIHRQASFVMFLITNGRIFQWVIERFVHTIFTYGNSIHYDLMRSVVLIFNYLFYAILFLVVSNAMKSKFFALAFVILLSLTPILSALFQWVGVLFMTIGNIISAMVFSLAWFYYDKFCISDNNFSKIRFILFFTFISTFFAITAMISQTAIFTPLFFLVVFMLFDKDWINKVNVDKKDEYITLLQLINVYQRSVFIVVSVAVGCVFYVILWKLQILFLHYLYEHHIFNFTWIYGYRDSGYGHDIIGVAKRSLSGFINAVVWSLTYVGFIGGAYSKIIALLILLFIVYTLFYEVRNSYTQLLKKVYIFRILLILSCIIGSTAIMFLQSSLRVSSVFMMIMFTLFAYSLYRSSFVISIISGFTNKVSVDFVVLCNYILMCVIAFSLSNNYMFNIMHGWVYPASVEQLYVRATLINELNANANVTTIFIKQPNKEYCYYEPCIGEFGTKMFTTMMQYHIVDYALDSIGLKPDRFTLLPKAYVSYSEEELRNMIDKLDMNKTIVIDMQGLHEAFLATYNKDKWHSSETYHALTNERANESTKH